MHRGGAEHGVVGEHHQRLGGDPRLGVAEAGQPEEQVDRPVSIGLRINRAGEVLYRGEVIAQLRPAGEAECTGKYALGPTEGDRPVTGIVDGDEGECGVVGRGMGVAELLGPPLQPIEARVFGKGPASGRPRGRSVRVVLGHGASFDGLPMSALSGRKRTDQVRWCRSQVG